MTYLLFFLTEGWHFFSRILSIVLAISITAWLFFYLIWFGQPEKKVYDFKKKWDRFLYIWTVLLALSHLSLSWIVIIWVTWWWSIVLNIIYAILAIYNSVLVIRMLKYPEKSSFFILLFLFLALLSSKLLTWNTSDTESYIVLCDILGNPDCLNTSIMFIWNLWFFSYSLFTVILCFRRLPK